MHPFKAYTREILPFKLGESTSATPQPSTPQAMLAAVKAWNKAPGNTLCILGLGDGSLVSQLDAALPPTIPITVSELSPDVARACIDAPWNNADSRVHLIADTSPWAHLILWAQAGMEPDTTILRVQDTGPEANTLRRAFAASSLLPHEEAPGTPLTVAAILSPADPGLADFFAHIPATVQEVVIVWDGDKPPSSLPECQAPVRHLARPLAHDFAAQRNAMLEACPEGWVMVLDADERLTASGWEAVHGLARRAERAGVNGFFLPRRTLTPDGQRFLAGYGLWPDLQSRLFRKTPGVHYERPIHERLAGTQAPFGIATNVSILHLSHVLKTPEQLRQKLAGFDVAAAGGVNHRLADEYPTIPMELFPDAAHADAASALVLPFSPA